METNNAPLHEHTAPSTYFNRLHMIVGWSDNINHAASTVHTILAIASTIRFSDVPL